MGRGNVREDVTDFTSNAPDLNAPVTFNSSIYLSNALSVQVYLLDPF